MKVHSLVYIDCPTYNQHSYIKDALDGFCKQETSFPYVCGIIDDASTDGEQDVIIQYLRNNFNLDDKGIAIREELGEYVRIFARHKTNTNCYFLVVFLSNNHYQIKKSRFPYVAEWRDSAKYVAICEGDDYWISKDKLQQQFDYLESHEQCGLVYSRAKVLSAESGLFSGFVGEKCESFSELLLKNSIPTLTVMYRLSAYQHYLRSIEPNKHRWRMGDYPCWLFFSANYDVYFMDIVTAIYRVSEGSASRPKSYENKIAFLTSTRDIQLFFSDKYGGEKTRKSVEKNYEDSCIQASILYKQRKAGLHLLLTSKRLSLRQKIVYFYSLLRINS